MTRKPTHTGLSVDVVRDEEQGVYFFGTTIDGAFVSFGTRKLGGIDQDIAAAQAAKKKKRKPEAEASDAADD